MNRNLVACFTIVLLNIYLAETAEIQIETLKEGDGRTFPQRNQKAVVHYTGTLQNGKEFDSSRSREPFRFTVGKGQVIKCWDEGVAKMSIGQRVRLTCPSDKAYGARGFPPVIPAHAKLTFDVELLEIE